MKVLNIILSVFIFIFAAASAVCSYFLFEKRTQFVKAHQKMAAAIYETSKTLDGDSGTDYAKELTGKELAHENYSKLDSKLPGFKDQSRNIINQRDAMADALSNIGNILIKQNNASANADAASFKKIDQYDSSIKAVASQLNVMVKNRNNTYKTLESIAKNRGGVKVEDLKKGKAPAEVLKPFNTFITKTIDNSNSYRSALSEVAAIAGGDVNVSDSDRDNGIKAVKDTVSKRIAIVKNLEAQLKKANAEKVRFERAANAANKKADAFKKAKDLADKRLIDFKKNIGVSATFEEWASGSEEARERLYGRVTGVSEEYGYFVIDLGSKSAVLQKDTVTGNTIPISLKLTDGIELVIVRCSDKEDPKSWYGANGAVIKSVELAKKDGFVAISKIVKVGENESVVDLPAGKTVKVGDVVLYKSAAK